MDVYLACLELGKAKVSELARKSGVERTNCYSILDKLISLGLVNVRARRSQILCCGDARKDRAGSQGTTRANKTHIARIEIYL